MKACPFCAEEIQDAAIVCKHCGRDLPPAIPAWEAEARALSREAGKVIHAVQRVKIANPSMSLKEAKALVDRWQREDGTAPSPKVGGLTGKLTGTQQLIYGGIALILILSCCAGFPWFISDRTTTPSSASRSSSPAPIPPVATPLPAARTKAPAASVPAAKAPAPAGTRAIAGDNWFGCADRPLFERLARYATQGDADAFKSGLGGGLVTGTCTTFNNGEAVYVVDSAMLSGLTKVRRAGQTAEYWTNVEAVR